MDHKKELEKLNKRSLERFEKYMASSKDRFKEEEHQKITTAKEEWQIAWNKFMETLMMLERLEI
jgi:hypothetical protein